MKRIITCINSDFLLNSNGNASIWICEKSDLPLTLLHIIEKSQNSNSNELSGEIGIDCNKKLLKQLLELDEKRSKIEIQRGKELLERAEKTINAKATIKIKKIQRHGSLIGSLKSFKNEMDMLIIGKSDHLHESQAIGSKLESVIRSVKKSTLVVNNNFNVPESFLFAFNGHNSHIDLINIVINSKLLSGLECHLVMIDPNDKYLKKFNNAALQLKNAGITVIEHISKKDIVSSLLDYQKEFNIGLIAMGAYNSSKVKEFFLGSNTTKMLTLSPVPLLLLR